MLEKGKISFKQATLLIVSTIFATMVIYLPSFIVGIAAQDGWLSVLPAILLGLLIGAVNTRLGERFPDQTIIQYAPFLLGWLPGKIVGFIFIANFILLNAFIVREFAEIMLAIFLPETPMYIFILSIILVVAYAVGQGLEVLARANVLTFYVYTAIMIIILGLNIPDASVENITPLLEDGFRRVITGAYPATTFFSEVFLITMLIPYLVKPRDGRRAAFWGVIIAGSLLFALMLVGIAVLNCEADRTQFIALSLARRISVREFIERLDPLVMLMWMGGLFVKTSVFYFVTVLGSAQWLGIKNYKLLILPAGVIIGVMAEYLWPNSLLLRYQIAHILPMVAIPQLFGIPLLMLIVAIFKGKGSIKK